MNENKIDDWATVNYRLDKIENQLSKLSELILNNALQQKDLEALKTKIAENDNVIVQHDKRIRKLEEKPFLENSQRWEKVVNIIMKAIETVFIAFVMIKFGLK